MVTYIKFIRFYETAFIMNSMANSYYILQTYNAKSFKMRHIRYLYFSYLSRYSLIQIQVTIFLSGTDITLLISFQWANSYNVFEKRSLSHSEFVECCTKMNPFFTSFELPVKGGLISESFSFLSKANYIKKQRSSSSFLLT